MTVTAIDQRPPGRRRNSAVREALLHSAAELFAAKGYGGTSTKEIARAANTSETTIYRQFGSKDELFTAAVFEPFSAFLDEYRAWFADVLAQEGWTDRSITEKAVERLYHYIRENRNSVLAMLSVHADPAASEPARAAAQRLEDFFETLYEIGMERWRRDPSVFDARRLRMVDRFFVGMVLLVSALDRWFVPQGDDAPSTHELVEAVTQLIMYGLYQDPQHGTADTASLPEQLKMLADLKAAGSLTPAEFKAAKAKLLS